MRANTDKLTRFEVADIADGDSDVVVFLHIIQNGMRYNFGDEHNNAICFFSTPNALGAREMRPLVLVT